MMPETIKAIRRFTPKQIYNELFDIIIYSVYISNYVNSLNNHGDIRTNIHSTVILLKDSSTYNTAFNEK
jgi:hypothetical protein